MEALDGIVKHPVCQDIMVFYVQRHVSVRLNNVIKRPGVRHKIMRQVGSTLCKF